MAIEGVIRSAADVERGVLLFTQLQALQGSALGGRLVQERNLHAQAIRDAAGSFRITAATLGVINHLSIEPST